MNESGYERPKVLEDLQKTAGLIRWHGKEKLGDNQEERSPLTSLKDETFFMGGGMKYPSQAMNQ